MTSTNLPGGRRGFARDAGTCPNRACPHPLLVHDIDEHGPRIDYCDVQDCPCGRGEAAS